MIPKIIHYCWLSDNLLPDKIKRCIESWNIMLPDYEVILWNRAHFDINSVRWVKEAYGTKKYAFAADYIRFYALFNYGGIYLDSDVEVLKSFNDLLDCKSFMGFEYSGIPEAAIIGAEANCEWIKECLSWYSGESFFDGHGKKREFVVPMLIKRIYENTNGINLLDDGIVKNVAGHKIYPYIFFSPKNPYTGCIESSSLTYAIHHFESAWLNKKSFIFVIKRFLHLLLLVILGKSNKDKFVYRLRKNKI